MSLPNLPITNIVDSNGELSNEWRIFFESQSRILQAAFTPSGTRFPFKTSEQIDDFDNPAFRGAIAYNNDSKNLQANTEGTYKPVSTYEQKTTSQIDQIAEGQRNGRLIWDTDENALKVGANDSFYTLTTS